MTDEKGHTRRNTEKMKPGGVAIMGIIITAMIAVVIAAVLEYMNTETEIEIDPQKNVYLFLHGRADLQEKAETALVTYGFPKKIIM